MLEFISENLAAILWLLAAVALLAVEAATVQLVSIWLCLGAFAATLAAVFGAGVEAQFAVFILVSAAALLGTRPFVKKALRVKRVHTNADSVIGMTGAVLEEIDNIAETGRVRVNGLDWSARSAGGETIPVGAAVAVEDIEGVKVIVRPAK